MVRDKNKTFLGRIPWPKPNLILLPWLVLGLFFFFLPQAVGEDQTADMNQISLQFLEFTGDPGKLNSRIDDFLQKAPKVEPEGRIVGLVSPHAGYRYSGGTAGWAFRQVVGESYDTVVVLGPSHRHSFRGINLLTGEKFRTPLGDIPIDGELVKNLLTIDGIFADPNVRQMEHSVEVQLPFLQTALSKFSLVYGIVGYLGPADIARLGEQIAQTLGKRNVLLVASTDMSHYHPPAEAESIDAATIEVEKNMNWGKLYEYLYKDKKGELCGGMPTCLVMAVSRGLGAERLQPLVYRHSGQVTGETAHGVVGYQAAMMVAVNKKEKTMGKLNQGDISPDQQSYLLGLARRTIEAYLGEKPLPDDKPEDSAINQARGCFVTLKKNDRLRGCIGNFQSNDSLYRNVMAMAIEAAVRDPRFPQVTADEIPQLTFEISALTPLRRISSFDEIEVGRDGIYVIKGYRRGVLLPQVAVEWGWDRDEFLSQTCVKAGLPPDIWKNDPELEVYVFSAQIFSEIHDAGR